MKRPSLWTRLRYSYFAKPVEERPLYREMLKRPVARIVEIGLGDCDRAERLIRLAIKLAGRPVTYTGIDPFESASAGQPRMKYKDAYKRLNFTGCSCKLVPGDPLSALTRVANTLTGTELLVIGSGDEQSMRAAWRYVPRMLDAQSRVFLFEAGKGFRGVSEREVSDWAARAAETVKRVA